MLRTTLASLRFGLILITLVVLVPALGPLTMSFGLAVFPEHGSDAAGLLQAADRALYRAKHEGRNRVATSRAGDLGHQPEPVGRAA